MKALVTGISGFAGSHLAEHLLAEGDELVGATRGAPPTVPGLRDAVPCLTWDITREAPTELYETLVRFAPDAVFHLAALSLPHACGDGEPNAAARQVNVEGTRHVLELAASLPSRPAVLVTSSSYVYAPVGPDDPPVDERWPTHPATGYGHSKLAAEAQARAAATSGLRSVIVRAFHHTGPRQPEPLMLAEWAAQLVRPDAGVIRVRSLDSYLDLSDVRDVVRAYRLLVQPGIAPGVYNVGSGMQRRSGDVLDELLSVVGAAPRVEVLAPDVRRHPIADITKLVAATGWSPQIPWSQTLADQFNAQRATRNTQP